MVAQAGLDAGSGGISERMELVVNFDKHGSVSSHTAKLSLAATRWTPE